MITFPSAGASSLFLVTRRLSGQGIDGLCPRRSHPEEGGYGSPGFSEASEFSHIREALSDWKTPEETSCCTCRISNAFSLRYSSCPLCRSPSGCSHNRPRGHAVPLHALTLCPPPVVPIHFIILSSWVSLSPNRLQPREGRKGAASSAC